MSESPATWSDSADRWLEVLGNVVDIVAGILWAAFTIWLVVRIVNDWPNRKTKGMAFWMAAGMLTVGALSLGTLLAILWLAENFK